MAFDLMNLEIQALSDPKRKLTAKQRRKFWSLHEKVLTKPWWKHRPARVPIITEDGRETRLERANRLRERRQKPSGLRVLGPEPTSEGLKVVRRLHTMPLQRVIRFMRKSARRAATAMYASKKTEGPISDSLKAEQDKQVALFRAACRIIDMRQAVNPNYINPALR